MGIGTSLGAYYDNDHHFAAAMWDHKYDGNDNNVLDPDIANPEDGTASDKNVVDPVTKTPDFMTQVSDIYDTPLTADEQAAYSQKYSSADSTDYDMQGFFQDNPNVDPHTDGTHYPDTYKKPNHPTFSDESMYNGVGGNQGGTWGTTADGKDTFTPGPTNMQNLGISGLIDYFDKTEPNAVLLMPKSK